MWYTKLFDYFLHDWFIDFLTQQQHLNKISVFFVWREKQGNQSVLLTRAQ